MKLRLRDNSIRLRLMQGEVAVAQETGSVSGHTQLGGGALLTYRLRASEAADCSATLVGSSLVVSVPAAVLNDWAMSGQVSIEARQVLDDGQTLRILVEKDFACLADRPGEDDSDAYPHPGEG